MNVGDLVEYKTWKAIITNKVNKGRPERDLFLYTLHFLGDPQSFSGEDTMVISLVSKVGNLNC